MTAASSCSSRPPARFPKARIDQRLSAYREAEAALRAAEAALQTARLNLSYTDVKAPVAGRVGKLEITVGNLVAAGPGAPVLTTLVSVSPIYASFSADEEVVMRALKALTAEGHAHGNVERIPVEMTTVTSNGTTFKGNLQLIDNQVDARSGTVRVRAMFDNAQGHLMPGQFARLRMGQAKTEPALVVSERAVGTDQSKTFVMVVDADSKAAYREVTLGRIRRRHARGGERPAGRRAHHRQRAAARASGRAGGRPIGLDGRQADGASELGRRTRPLSANPRNPANRAKCRKPTMVA